ncbi:hypothetical protein WDU94_000520 [Cyamophila willieti]
MTGFFIFGYSALHTVMHLLNFSLNVLGDGVINKRGLSLTEWLFTSRPGLFGLISGWANPTGTFVRKSGSFEVFYWTHLLYVPFWVLLILHCPNFWKWVIIPGIIYTCERIFRFTIMRCKRGKTYISSGLLLPSKVTHLVIKRPQHFDFHPGDYVFVNIPAIAQYEWHPFTISSAPEQEGYMWLHIRGVGEWTNRLYDYFEKEQDKLHNLEESLPLVNTPTVTPPTPTGVNPPMTPSGVGAGSLQSIGQEKESNPIRRIHKTLERKFSGKALAGGKVGSSPSSLDANIRGKMVVFKNHHGSGTGYTNESFCSLPEDFKMTNHGGSPESDMNIQSSIESLSSIKNLPLHKVVLLSKSPLSKSLSMPDMDNKVKKRQRLLALREYMRSESEKSFDECQMRRARLQSLGLAYLSPQNKSLAQSFRYMRNKPTIIAFKTPSLESCEAKLSALSILTQGSDIGDSASLAEEGRHITPGKSHPHTPINYPVGKPLEIYLDGPYGAPSSHIFRAQHAVLIGTGIGVTPFASILQSIMHRYWKARHECPRCRHTWVSEIPPTIMHLRKVDFFWINRDQRSFEWFVNLLSQLEIEQAELGGAMERFLDMHMYITSALQKTDMKAVGLQLALDLLHEKEKRDLITGLKTRTNAGRPNWDKVFKHLLDQKKGKVTVFYCGPPQLARILRLKCDQFGFSFRKEVF